MRKSRGQAQSFLETSATYPNQIAPALWVLGEALCNIAANLACSPEFLYLIGDRGISCGPVNGRDLPKHQLLVEQVPTEAAAWPEEH